MKYPKPIAIQQWNEDDIMWIPYFNCHARVNKTGGNENYAGGAIQNTNNVTFDVRYCKEIALIEFSTMLYRIIFNGATFDIKDYDDFMYQHCNVKLIGVGKRV